MSCSRQQWIFSFLLTSFICRNVTVQRKIEPHENWRSIVFVPSAFAQVSSEDSHPTPARHLASHFNSCDTDQISNDCLCCETVTNCIYLLFAALFIWFSWCCFFPSLPWKFDEEKDQFFVVRMLCFGFCDVGRLTQPAVGY